MTSTFLSSSFGFPPRSNHSTVSAARLGRKPGVVPLCHVQWSMHFLGRCVFAMFAAPITTDSTNKLGDLQIGNQVTQAATSGVEHKATKEYSKHCTPAWTPSQLEKLPVLLASPLAKSVKSLLFRFSPTFEGTKFFSHKRVEEGFVKTIQVVVGFRKCPKVVKLREKERYLSLNFEAGLTRSAAL